MMTNAHLHIAPDIAGRISTELRAIEIEHGVRVLLAVESGSRAWGFPSRDSDYDIRFIYVRPVEGYLTVIPRRDVIERPVDAVLDVSGWDVRKALQLMLRSNAVLQEWLSSPIRYVDCQPVREKMSAFLQVAVDLRAFEYHYDHQARRSFDEITTAGDTVRLKSYCYALRATFAICWLRERRSPPPMDLRSLMSGLDLHAQLVTEIFDLLDRKLVANEQGTGTRILILDEFIEKTLAQAVGQAGALDRSDIVTQADAFLASVVQGLL
jgi:uncharacterized protein